jgi:hypothetical protein
MKKANKNKPKKRSKAMGDEQEQQPQEATQETAQDNSNPVPVATEQEETVEGRLTILEDAFALLKDILKSHGIHVPEL